ncbi:winged helix family transcriptional regulator [Aestuariimicrobium ganziense]|uniref:winged helix family transcriptional regulator n=1 Tax=Aestuariimicrobium ganziense TaxID=2773677 RepID=UPI0019416FDB|nr:response regulator transcription factor [Aestuariimicrobium ganziense]
MAVVHLVGPEGAAAPPPSALTLLAHDVVVIDTERVIALDDGVIVVDARSDLARGRELCIAVRSRTNLPVLLVLTGSSLAAVQRNWGADDFILDTAEPVEWDARIRHLISGVPEASLIRSGAIVIDEGAYTAAAGDQQLDLTYTEFELLKYLALHPGRVLSREHLLSEVWGYDYFGGTRTVDVHVRRLRAKLGAEHEGHIGTVRNVGYRFDARR